MYTHFFKSSVNFHSSISLLNIFYRFFAQFWYMCQTQKRWCDCGNANRITFLFRHRCLWWLFSVSFPILFTKVVNNYLQLSALSSYMSVVPKMQVTGCWFMQTNTLRAFQRCIMTIFSDMVEHEMEVFIDDFSVFSDNYDDCLQVLRRCFDTNLILN